LQRAKLKEEDDCISEYSREKHLALH